MAEKMQVYKCEVCGNIVEILHAGVGELVCCGQPMKLQTERTGDTGTEKHTPVIEKLDGKVRVKVGSVTHPMEEGHYIEWVELVTDSGMMRRFLKPGEEPVAEFDYSGRVVGARSYCNLHGLWKSE